MHHPDHIMVLQVLTDTGQIVDHGKAKTAQMIAGPNAGNLQQMRRIDSAAGKNHLGPCVHLPFLTLLLKAHTGTAFAIHHQAGCLGVGFNTQIC